MRKHVLALLFSALAGATALATVMVPLSLDQLTGESDAVVLGHCIDKRVYKTGEMIYTEYTVRVYDVLKGSTLKEVKVVQPGGESGGKGIYVAGVARFAPAEEVMLFLGKDIGGRRDLVGWSQGKFTIYYDAKSKTKFAVRQLGGIGFMKKSSGEISSGKPEQIKLDELKSRVKKIIAEQKAKAGKK